MNRQYAVIAIVWACLSATASCHSAAPDDETRVGESQDSPAIHAVMRWERVLNGKNVPREDYSLLMESCKAAGWPTKELTLEDIQKLGTGKVEIWRDVRGAYGRQTTWELGAMDPAALDGKGACLAKLEEDIVEEDDDYTGRDGLGAAISKTEQDAEAKILGFERVGAAQIKGQPCTRWRSKGHEVCTWSTGASAGIDDGPVDSLCITQGPMAYLNPMPLESKQGAEGAGCNLQLQSMTVSKGLLPEVAGALGATQTEE